MDTITLVGATFVLFYCVIQIMTFYNVPANLYVIYLYKLKFYNYSDLNNIVWFFLIIIIKIIDSDRTTEFINYFLYK